MHLPKEAAGKDLLWDPAKGDHELVSGTQRIYDAVRRNERMRGVDEEERARRAFLNKLPAANPPELLELVPVRVLRAFCVGGQRMEPGATVKLARHDAVSLAAIGKAELVPEQAELVK
jgi:hypothetical protein